MWTRRLRMCSDIIFVSLVVLGICMTKASAQGMYFILFLSLSNLTISTECEGITVQAFSFE